MQAISRRSSLNHPGAGSRALVRMGLVLALLCLVLPASGLTKTLTVACPQQTISAAVATLKPAADYQVINVSGACAENVYIPSGLSVSIVAASGASLSPGPAAFTTIDVQGRLYLYGLAVQTQPGVGIFVHDGAYASLVGGSVTGPGTGVQVSDNAGVVLQNETVLVTGYSAINAYDNGTIEVDGIAPTGSVTGSSLTGAGDGINCAQGNVTLNASGGPITISNSGGAGVDDQGCNFTDYVSNGQTIAISNNGGVGFNAAQASSVTLAGVQITGNTGGGIYAQMNAAVQLSGGMKITGNGGAALQASQNAVYVLVNYSGINLVSEPSGDTALCSVAIKEERFT